MEDLENIIEKLEYSLDTLKEVPMSRQEQRIILAILKGYYETKAKEPESVKQM